MAILAINKAAEGRGSRTAKDGSREQTDVYNVDVDSATVQAETVERATGGTGSFTRVPRRGDKHPEVPGSRVIMTAASPRGDDRLFWTVTVTYSSKYAGGESDTPTDADNPLDDPADISFPNERERKLIIKDIFGAGILNSAGDILELLDFIYLPRITISNNISVDAWSHATQDLFLDSINVNEVLIAGRTLTPLTGKIDMFTGVKQHRNGISYYKRTISIIIKKALWLEPLVDAGFNEVADNPLFKRQILIKGKPAQTPQLLDGAGAAITNPATPAVFRDFSIKFQQAFEDLNLPKAP